MTGRTKITKALADRTRLRTDTTVMRGGYLLEVRRSNNRWVCVSQLPPDLPNARRVQKAIDDTIKDAVEQALGRKT